MNRPALRPVVRLDTLTAAPPCARSHGGRVLPDWWIDEAKIRIPLSREANGYDVPQTTLDASTGMAQANHILQNYLRS